MNKYQKFKKLLEYFVSHLEWLINQDINNRGYNVYIKPLVDNDNFYSTGQGYKDANIQSHIKDWADYDNGTICINIQPNYGNYKTVKCYLNWKGTGINIIANPHWNNINEITDLIIHTVNNNERRDIETKSIADLGLFDNQQPNETLKSFFDEFERLIIEHNKKEKTNKNMETVIPYVDLLTANKNLILTGAPGTGKTYLAKQIAEAMNAKWTFVQFHPSYDYTDFVEGLRPTPPDDNGNIGFERKDGVFKEFCKKALKNRIDSHKTVEELSKEQNIEEFVDNFLNDAIENETEFETTFHKIQYQIIEMDNDIIKIEHGNFNNREYDPKNKYSKISRQDLILLLSAPKKLENKKDIASVLSRTITPQKGNYLFSVYSEAYGLLSSDNIDNKKTEKIALQKFVFIIDEINRGEISKIFGELFFSIDPSYRGTDGKVQTQYANMQDKPNEFDEALGIKEQCGHFYVPENVYIIGTMNDIDRSVESFDFAMRRRFTWKEITAKESQRMFDDPNWKVEAIKRMDSLNKAISDIQGLGSAYHIGGAYFKNNLPKHNDDFGKVWEYHIAPLLKEYLRGMPDAETKVKELQNAFNLTTDITKDE